MEHNKEELQAYLDTYFNGRTIRNMIELWPELKPAVPDGNLIGKVVEFQSGSIVIEGGKLVVK